MRIIAAILVVAGLVAAGFAGMSIVEHLRSPAVALDTQVRNEGIFGSDTNRLLATAVTNLRAQNRLVVYSYTGSADVEVERRRVGGLLRARQVLSVPATITYHLDLSRLTMDDVRMDEASRTLTVTLPPLALGDIAMAPERARVFSRGLLSTSDDVVQEMARSNYAFARQVFIAQAQQAEIVALARRNARIVMARPFVMALEASGADDIRVEVVFRPRVRRQLMAARAA